MLHRHFNLINCFAVIGVLMITSVTHAGVQARIEGIVTDRSGEPIAGATITITSAEVAGYEKVLKTDKRGKFKTLILDATRNYFFKVEADGYVAEERPFKVGAGSTDNLFEFKLKTMQQAVAEGSMQLQIQPGYKELGEARDLMQAGDTEGARAKFAEAVAADPDLLPALEGLAELTYDAGDMEGALSAAEKCLVQDEESINCLAIAANASGQMGKADVQAEYLARYQAVNPDDPTILFNDAAVYLNKLDDEGARPLLEKCLEADADFPPCIFEYGMLLLRIGDMEGAKKYLEKYLELAPDGPNAATAQETIKYL